MPEILLIPQSSGGGGGTGPEGPRGYSILHGKGAPAPALGNNEEFYYDEENKEFYGPKTAGSWGVGFKLKGETGATGATGPEGPKGTTGATGPEGPAGAAAPKPLEDHAFAVVGAVAAGTLPGLGVMIEAGEEKKLLAITTQLESGTSVECELLRNNAKQGEKFKVEKGVTRHVMEQVLADKDYFALVVSAPVGAPVNLSYTFHVKKLK